MDIVIVESPAKAKTITKYLGDNYQVLASYGHVRDLPSKDGSVDPNNDFTMNWAIDAKAKKRLNEIASIVKKADRLILATDPDREGEAISWHILQVLKDKKALQDKTIQRVAFNAITEQAIKQAISNPRDIDTALVESYLARRALDYLVGFTLSPILWRKLPGARSAGRVQSVALRLVCSREAEIETFKPQEYWSVIADLKTTQQQDIKARLNVFNGQKIQRLTITDEKQAHDIQQMLEQASFKVANIETKPQRRHPLPPFTTSTLQQEASRKLGFSANHTMRIAQNLYEGVDIGGETTGLITYMRTDGVDMAPEAIHLTRTVIGETFGSNYLPEKQRKYFTKSKNAQEAHEAIRPTSVNRHPTKLIPYLNADQAKLYELIWKRAMASQMASATFERTTIDIAAEDGTTHANLQAIGSVLCFDGFLKLYQQSQDDGDDETDVRLPAVHSNEPLKREKIITEQHFTEPPPRYTEATLIRKMEELGIGRPSTYASTLSILRDRDYVALEKKRLLPKDKGRIVTAFLEGFFKRYVEYDFTAKLEEQLDQISAGDLNWRAVLTEFWSNFSANVDDIKELRIAQVLDALNDILGPYIFPSKPDGGDPRACPQCENGRLSLKISKYGVFIGCSNYPECNFTKKLGEAASGDQSSETNIIHFGDDPDTGLAVTGRTGRFGPFIQLGADKKPKRASLPKGWQLTDINLDQALQLLTLPRLVGQHPETGQPITAGIGRYGPFVMHQGVYANLDSVEEVFSVGTNRAVAALADKAAKGKKQGATNNALKDLGMHPDDGGAIKLYNGRYGPYIKYGKINVSIPKGADPDSIALDEALTLIANKTKTGKAKKASQSKTSS